MARKTNPAKKKKPHNCSHPLVLSTPIERAALPDRGVRSIVPITEMAFPLCFAMPMCCLRYMPALGSPTTNACRLSLTHQEGGLTTPGPQSLDHHWDETV